MSDPVRNILVYGDGRVEEVSFRLAGRYYIQTESLGDGRIRERRFEGQYACSERNPEHPAPYTVVYVERPDSPDYPPAVSVLVNATPVRVDVPVSAQKIAREIHRDCLSRGGHKQVDSDTCSQCGLSGYVVRMVKYDVQREEEKRTEVAGLRDQLVKMRDENRDLLAENGRLRRALEQRVNTARVKP